MLAVVLCGLAVLVLLLYRYSTSTFGYWAAKGVPFPKPVPLFGNNLKTFLGKQSRPQAQLENYRFFGEARYGGIYFFRRPTLFIKDPNLVEQAEGTQSMWTRLPAQSVYPFNRSQKVQCDSVRSECEGEMRGLSDLRSPVCWIFSETKMAYTFVLTGPYGEGLPVPDPPKEYYHFSDDDQEVESFEPRTSNDPEFVILIKDFSTFYNRGTKPDFMVDPLSAHLVYLENEQWKSIRNKLTPAFSSGKLKFMHEQFLEVSEVLVQQLAHFAASGQPFEAKRMMSNFALDLIGSVAFGLADPNSELKKIAEQVFQPSLLDRLRIATLNQFPRLIRLLNWREFSMETEEFLMRVVKDTMKYREEKNVQRNDFLQLLIELRKQEKLNTIDNDELVFDDRLMTANSFVLLLAGYETTASTISFLLYELAANQHIQEQVLAEIRENVEKHGGPTYEAINEMVLLDQALAETLRLYPPSTVVVRKSRCDYRMPDSQLTLPAGSHVLIPVYSLQRDPRYWKDPERFWPQRFADPANIRKGTYLPFGDGPRICIGARLAKMEVKVAIVKLLLNYKVSVNEKTQIPFRFERTLLLKTQIWLNLVKRT